MVTHTKPSVHGMTHGKAPLVNVFALINDSNPLSVKSNAESSLLMVEQELLKPIVFTSSRMALPKLENKISD